MLRATSLLLLLTLAPRPAVAQSRDGGAPVSLALRAAAGAAPALSLDEAGWVRARLLGAIADATGALLAPTAPEARDGVTTWSLLADAGLDRGRLAGACAAVERADRRVACAVDALTWAGAERGRVTLAWRSPAGRPAVSFVQPLRALARFGGGLCLVHAERTPRTLDVTVRAGDPDALGRALARFAVSPGLTDLMLVRQEPRGGGLEALLSWPLARAEGAGDLADDPWPTRCEGRSTVGGEARAGTAPVLRERVRGTQARGAVVRVGRREWLVTAGDLAAGTTVVGVRDDGVTVRPAGSPRGVVLRFPPERGLPATAPR